MSKVLAVAKVQAAKLRRRKIVWLFGLVPTALALLMTLPQLLMNQEEFAQFADNPLFTWGLVTGMGSTMSVVGRILALILGAIMVDADIRDGTLFPMLAKPISRARALLGRYIGCAAILGLFLGIEVVSIAFAAWRAGPGGDWLLLARAVCGDIFLYLMFMSLGMLAGILVRPVLGVSAVLFFAFCYSALMPTLINLSHPLWKGVGIAMLALFPAGGEIAAWTNFTASSPLSESPVVLQLLYALVWSMLLMALAIWRFERRELLR